MPTSHGSESRARDAERVFVLRFSDGDALGAGFEIVSESSHVDSMLLEAESLRLRFVATRAAGANLAERIDARGGLVFLSSHQLLSPSDP